MPFPNLATQFRPGDDWKGNPSGRPKGRSLTSILREVLDATEIGGSALPSDKRVADVVIEALIGHAVAGDAALLKEILNRIDGKVPDRIAGPEGESLFPPGDLSRLSRDELLAFRSLLAKLSGQPVGGPP